MKGRSSYWTGPRLPVLLAVRAELVMLPSAAPNETLGDACQWRKRNRGSNRKFTRKGSQHKECFAQVSINTFFLIIVPCTDDVTVSGEAPQVPVVSRKSGTCYAPTISKGVLLMVSPYRYCLRETSDRGIHIRKWDRPTER